MRVLSEKVTRRRAIGAVMTLATLLASLLLLIWILPFDGAPQMWRLQAYVSPETAADKAALLQAQVQASAVLVQLLGGLLLIGTLYTAIHSVRQAQQGLELSREQLRIAQEQLRNEAEINREQLRIAQEGQITERFTHAIEQLGATNDDGSPRLEIRLGGIYALERIARDSLRDCGPIMEVLTAYVRQHTAIPQNVNAKRLPETDVPKLAVDIQTILTVIGRRSDEQRKESKGRLNLSRTNLGAAYLFRANLKDVDFHEAHLARADLTLADLSGGVLSKANLVAADLKGAHLEGAYLGGAKLERANLRVAKLEGAQLWNANLERADLYEANLTGAEIINANLANALLVFTNFTGARLAETNLEGARFGGTNLEGASLREGGDDFGGLSDVRGLTQDQIDQTYMDDKTMLPEQPGPDGNPYRRSTRTKTAPT